MSGNFLLGTISIILAISPFLTRNAHFDRFFQTSLPSGGLNNFELMVVVLGGLGVALSLFHLFIKKKNGSIHIVIGALILVVGFFFNEEKFPLPNWSNLLQAELFFIFVGSFLLAVSGIIVEWLMD